MQTIRIKVTGKVQGVWYRQSAKEKAIALGITGIVRNMENGSVEIIATGTKEQLEELLRWCKTGPPKAIVSNAVAEEISLQIFTQFIINR